MDQQLGTSFYLPEGTDTACGIYMIRNVRNGKKYIGSTKNARNREKSHFKALSLGNHHCDHLQQAWNCENDKTVFKFSMFIYCREDQLIQTEQFCFNNMRPEYNSSLIAGRPEHTLSVRAKMSAKKKGRPSPRKGIRTGKPAWNSGVCTGRPSPRKGIRTGKPAWNSGISKTEEEKQVLRLKCSGWRHTDEVRTLISLAGMGREPWNKGLIAGGEPNAKGQIVKEIADETREKISEANKIALKKYFETEAGQIQVKSHAKIVSIKSTELWADEDFKQKTIAAMPRGEQHKLSRAVINLDTLEIFVNIAEASKYYNISNISSVCRGKRAHAGGFRFAYLSDHQASENAKTE
jgi:group I intron endonuclease